MPDVLDFRNFEPVALPEEIAGFEKASQTMLRHFNSCLRSAYFYLLYRGGPSSDELERGSGLHRVLELGTQQIIDTGDHYDERGRLVDEHFLPPEIVKDLVDEVLADPEYAIPFEEHDYLRESAFRWASETMIRPSEVVSCETMFILDLEGFEIRMKIDLALLKDEGKRCLVHDYKSSRALPSMEDISRKRPDNTYAAKNFQLILYCLGLKYGVPVRVVEHVDGTKEEIREPFPVADRAQLFEADFVYPGIETKDGKMARREVTLTALELNEYLASLRGMLVRLRHARDTGNWPAKPGSHCVECPAPMLCPIPAELRDYAGSVNTMEEASEAAEKLVREQAVLSARQTELRNFAKKNGGIRFGTDQTYDFGYTESDKIADKDGMFDAMERAVRYGEPFDRSKFVKKSSSSPFKARTLTEDELALERDNQPTEEVNDGGIGNGADAGSSSADERWGDTLPD